MSHTPFCHYLEASHDGLYALVSRGEECPICGTYAHIPSTHRRRVFAGGIMHHPSCSVVSGMRSGADAPANAPLPPPTSAKTVAVYAGGLALLFGTGVVLKFALEGRRRIAEPLPERRRRR